VIEPQSLKRTKQTQLKKPITRVSASFVQKGGIRGDLSLNPRGIEHEF
jgi:hypothetical protein